MFILFFFICLIVISGVYPILELSAKIVLFSYVFFVYFKTIKRNNLRIIYKDRFILLFAFLALIWFLIRTINIDGFKLFLQFLILIMSIYLFEYTKMLVVKGINFVFVVLCGISLLSCLNIYDFFLNSNNAGIITLVIGYFAFVFNKSRKGRFLIVILVSVLLLIWNSRSVILSIFLSVIIVEAYRKMKCKYVIIGCIFIMIPLIIYSLQGIIENYYSPELDQTVLEYTGKRLDSGRLRIWNEIFQTMSPLANFIGLGGGYNYWGLIRDNISLHSGYIYIYASYGFIGLILVSTLISLIIMRLLKDQAYFSACLFLIFVFREFFEVTLVYNNMALALLFWGVITKKVLDNSHKHDLI